MADYIGSNNQQQQQPATGGFGFGSQNTQQNNQTTGAFGATANKSAFGFGSTQNNTFGGM